MTFKSNITLLVSVCNMFKKIFSNFEENEWKIDLFDKPNILSPVDSSLYISWRDVCILSTSVPKMITVTNKHTSFLFFFYQIAKTTGKT